MSANMTEVRKDIQPSMKRRMAGKDYCGRGIYMLTLATEGRLPLLAQVTGTALSPCVTLTPLGTAVAREIENIPRYYPQVRIIGKQVMPDHVHFIVFVTEHMPLPLGRVVNGFKAGCRRAMRALVVPHSGLVHDTRSVACGAAQQSHDRQHCVLWELGYHDRVLSGRHQLQHMIDYIHDNPRRLLLRRTNPQWLRPHYNVRVGRQVCSAIGNLSLLERPCMAVRVSRRCTEEQIQSEMSRYMAAARSGTVLVSPSISPGEKRVMRAAFDAHLPLIVLVENGFTDYSKPSGEQFDACTEGRLLLLSPWEHHTDRRPLTAGQCQCLNILAAEIQTGKKHLF